MSCTVKCLFRLSNSYIVVCSRPRLPTLPPDHSNHLGLLKVRLPSNRLHSDIRTEPSTQMYEQSTHAHARTHTHTYPRKHTHTHVHIHTHTPFVKAVSLSSTSTEPCLTAEYLALPRSTELMQPNYHYMHCLDHYYYGYNKGFLENLFLS